MLKYAVHVCVPIRTDTPPCTASNRGVDKQIRTWTHGVKCELVPAEVFCRMPCVYKTSRALQTTCRSESVPAVPEGDRMSASFYTGNDISFVLLCSFVSPIRLRAAALAALYAACFCMARRWWEKTFPQTDLAQACELVVVRFPLT